MLFYDFIKDNIKDKDSSSYQIEHSFETENEFTCRKNRQYASNKFSNNCQTQTQSQIYFLSSQTLSKQPF